MVLILNNTGELALESMEHTPFFSIIISTRDRPELFQIALRSVMEQTFSDREVIIVVDGSSEANLAHYDEIEQQHDDIVFHRLSHRTNGHGQSYTMNYGVDHSLGQYLCFLDDDDHWTSKTYLEEVFANLSAAQATVDVHFSHQKAYFSDGTEQPETVWIEDLIPKVHKAKPNTEHSYLVDTIFLLSSGGFAHLNCSVFNRKFFESISRMDESIRYENDRDIYLRAIDAGETMLLSTRYMSLHNIPDISKKSNMSTMSSNVEKKLFQMRVYDKGIALGKRPPVVAFCSRAKVYELKHVATILADQRKFKSASHYAREGLMAGFNLRWLAYTLYLSCKALLNPQNAPKDGRA